MQHLQEPQVIVTYPGSLSRDITTSTQITINFNIDLHTKYLTDTVIVKCLETSSMDAKLEDPGVAARSTNVGGEITYSNKALIFTPSNSLRPDMVYHVMVISNATAQQGVRSVLGRFMARNHSFIFKTAQHVALNPVELISPSNNSVINGAPTFQWREIAGVKYYNVEVSRSNIFRTIHWSNHVDTSVASSPLMPGIHFDEALFAEDGIYYWRIQSVSWHGAESEYSSTFQFNINRSIISPVRPEDSLPVDPAAPDQTFNNLEIIDVFPENNYSNVGLNLKTIYIKVSGDLDPLQISRASISIHGKLIESGVVGEDHGEVPGAYTISRMTDETWLIAFSPASIEQLQY